MLKDTWKLRCLRNSKCRAMPTSSNACAAVGLHEWPHQDLASWGIAAGRIHTEHFGSGPSNTPGIAASLHAPPHLPAAPPGAGTLVSFARSRLDVRWGSAFQSILQLAEARDIPRGGRAALESVTRVNPELRPGPSPTGPTQSIHRRTAMC
jgi:hypothetical protein